MNATPATTAPDEYPLEVESTRFEEESLEESGEALFSDEASFGECFYKTIIKLFQHRITVSVFKDIIMDIFRLFL